jgi:hypothetical protein
MGFGVAGIGGTFADGDVGGDVDDDAAASVGCQDR